MPAKEAAFTSPNIAKEMKKAFGSKATSMSVKMLHSQVVADFVRKIEKAHQSAAKSELRFRGPME